MVVWKRMVKRSKSGKIANFERQKVHEDQILES
jgi:hypothetical protein